MVFRHMIIFLFLICSLLSNPVSAQRNSPPSQVPKVGPNTTALVACIRHDISRRSSTGSAKTSPLTMAMLVGMACNSQVQELGRAIQREQGRAFNQMTFERDWRAAIAVGVQQAQNGIPAHLLDFESGLKNGQTDKEFERMLQANVEATRGAAHTCLLININKYVDAPQETAEAVARVAIGMCKQDLARLNHASCLQVTGNDCTLDLSAMNTLERHIENWGPAVTATVMSRRSERQSRR